jgi:hypothetical protein
MMAEMTMPIIEPNTPALGINEMPSNPVEPQPTMPPNAIAQMEMPPYMGFFMPAMVLVIV